MKNLVKESIDSYLNEDKKEETPKYTIGDGTGEITIESKGLIVEGDLTIKNGQIKIENDEDK